MSTLLELIGLAASIKELTPLAQAFDKVEPTRIYAQAFSNIITQIFGNKLKLNQDAFVDRLSQKNINLHELVQNFLFIRLSFIILYKSRFRSV